MNWWLLYLGVGYALLTIVSINRSRYADAPTLEWWQWVIAWWALPPLWPFVMTWALHRIYTVAMSHRDGH